jgi:hypothetical protein
MKTFDREGGWDGEKWGDAFLGGKERSPFLLAKAHLPVIIPPSPPEKNI